MSRAIILATSAAIATWNVAILSIAPFNTLKLVLLIFVLASLYPIVSMATRKFAAASLVYALELTIFFSLFLPIPGGSVSLLHDFILPYAFAIGVGLAVMAIGCLLWWDMVGSKKHK
ncbi:hypothetical protein [Mesorhizobium sp.]|uniref:hypothetical protein n=1 Tax=Mesorhizobium sp. TaxID=1871066 RepID=UPI0025DD6097|nr:hypothetical protein [Mesorhizobium sp.]